MIVISGNFDLKPPFRFTSCLIGILTSRTVALAIAQKKWMSPRCEVDVEMESNTIGDQEMAIRAHLREHWSDLIKGREKVSSSACNDVEIPI
jgi:hypothetical protein